MDESFKREDSINNEHDTDTGNRIRKFENLYDFVIEQQQSLPAELENMRRKGETKTYKYRELFGRKLMNDSFILLLKKFDLM